MKKIIIGDSLKSFIEEESDFLSRKNIKIFTASNSEEILKIHGSENADLIITDIDIPGASVGQVFSSIRKDNALKDVSTIVVCDKSAIPRLQSCGANAFLTKPLNTEELFLMIEKFLDIPRRRKLRSVFQVSVKGKLKDAVFFANSENISSSGVFFETDEVLAKGDGITCSFFVGDRLTIINGEVVRIEKGIIGQYFYGIHFINLTPAVKTKLEDFMEIRRAN